jgi:hypothetical protein
MAAIQHQISGDLAQSGLTEPTNEQPEVFQIQLGVAITLDDKVALKGVAIQYAIYI